MEVGRQVVKARLEAQIGALARLWAKKASTGARAVNLREYDVTEGAGPLKTRVIPAAMLSDMVEVAAPTTRAHGVVPKQFLVYRYWPYGVVPKQFLVHRYWPYGMVPSASESGLLLAELEPWEEVAFLIAA